MLCGAHAHAGHHRARVAALHVDRRGDAVWRAHGERPHDATGVELRAGGVFGGAGGVVAAACGGDLGELRGEGSAQRQSLALPTTAVDGDGVLRVTLGEEKHEVTSLDGVYVEADGRRVAPGGCAGAVSAAGAASGVDAWCVADAESATLTPGQSLTLRFQVGVARSVTLWARGYYTTLPATCGGEQPLRPVTREPSVPSVPLEIPRIPMDIPCLAA